MFRLKAQKVLLIAGLLTVFFLGSLFQQQGQINEDTVQTLKMVVAQVEHLEKQIEADPSRDVKIVTVTAYSPTSTDCDSNPTVTACMQPVRPGIVAVSRDLFKSGWVFGKKVYIEGVGVFEILDLMNERWENRIDVLLFSEADVKDFGVKKGLTAALIEL